MVFIIDTSNFDKAEGQFIKLDKELHNDDETRDALEKKCEDQEYKIYKLENKIHELGTARGEYYHV